MATIINIFLVALTMLYLIVIRYLRKGWKSIPYFKSTGREQDTTVSVLIAARNEEHNIAATLADILCQDYPKHLFDIIVVDDHSTDDTAEIVSSFAQQGVRLIQLRENKPLNSYKKLALTRAIAQSNAELLVATDADCRMGKRWLSTLVALYEEERPHMISAPVMYHAETSLFEKLQTLEFLFLIGLGAAGIGNGKPSTCNGANLAYRRETFIELGGFDGIDHVASGDDELFLHKVSQKYPQGVRFCKSYDALVLTKAKESIGAFISQRKRWASKSTHYKNKSIVWLGVSIWLFNVVLLIGASCAFFSSQYVLVIVCLLLKYIAERWFMAPICGFAKRPRLLALLPILTLIHTFYIVYIGITGNIGRYQWKGRYVR